MPRLSDELQFVVLRLRTFVFSQRVTCNVPALRVFRQVQGNAARQTEVYRTSVISLTILPLFVSYSPAFVPSNLFTS